MQAKDPNRHMGVLEHLEELRQALLSILKGLVAASILSFAFSEYALQLLMNLASELPVEFVMISPTEGFMVQLRIGILLGIGLSLPNTIRSLWEFVAPGLVQSERKWFLISFPVLIGLFLSGSALALIFVIPQGLEFLLSFQIADVRPQLSIEKYVAFCSTILLVFGAAFQIPVFLLILNRLGALPVEWMRRFRRHLMVGMFVFSALLTPPDIVTQSLLAIPLIALYELTLLVIGFLEPSERKSEQ